MSFRGQGLKRARVESCFYINVPSCAWCGSWTQNCGSCKADVLNPYSSQPV